MLMVRVHPGETALKELIVAIEDTFQSEFLSKMSRLTIDTEC